MDISLVFTKEEREDLADGLDELLFILDNRLEVSESNQYIDYIPEIRSRIKRVGQLHDKITKGLYGDDLVNWGLGIYDDAKAERDKNES